jgi:sugar phosphate isomerase/epimerase
MKYAFMSFSCPRLSLAEMLALAQRLGYAGIEPRLSSGHAHGIETTMDRAARQTARRQIADSGIGLVCLATGITFVDPAKTAASMAEARRSIALAADVGCKLLRVFGGSLPAGMTRGQAIDAVTTNLSSLADEASAAGVALCIETHDDWTDPAHVAAVMRQVGDPAIAVNWDIMHPVRQSHVSIDDAFDALRPWIRHVHFHDGVDEASGLVLKPVGAGVIDHRRAVELLQAAGYTGYLSGEWIDWEPCEVHLPRDLATMKGYERAASLDRH